MNTAPITIKCEKDHKSLIRYLTVKLSPVLFGVKPAVMLRISNCSRVELENRYDVFCIKQDEILRSLNLRAFILNRNQKGALVFFYDRDALEKVLTDKKRSSFLENRGYYPSKGISENLEHLKANYDSGSFPHEVGIFLGYPLKDVKGFIQGKKGCPESIKCGWKVYGDPLESLKLKKAFNTAEKIAHGIFMEYENINICINKISSSKSTLTI